MKISIFGDLHYSDNYKEAEGFEVIREKYYSNFFESFFEEEADYYVSVGDLTNMGSVSELEGVYNLIDKARGDKRFIFTIGNHDVYSLTKAELKEQIGQELYFSIVDGDYCLIFLDSNREKNLADWSGYIDEEQLVWFKNTMIDNQDKIIIVFSHHPVYDTTLYSTADKASIVPEIPIDEIIFSHKTPAVYVCGHTHADSIVQKDNWTFVQIAAVLDQPTFRTLEFTEDGLTIESHGFDEYHRQNGSWLGSRMDHFNLVNRGYQGEENREARIEFK